MKSRVSRPTTESSQTYGEAVANSSHKPTRGSHSVTSDTPYVLEQQNRIAQLRDQQTKTQSDQTGLPAQLKAGIESLSGMSMDHVQVHYDSAKPADVGALAYTQGSEIHLGPGQEKHLPHEAWHVVQQAQQNVRATTQRKATPINDDDRLEREADQMGTRAMQLKVDRNTHGSSCGCSSCGPALQLKLGGAQSSRTDATSGKIVQLKCGKCGSNDHRTNNCPRTPQQLEEHKEKVKTFQKLKNEKLQELAQKEKAPSKEKGRQATTSAFSNKHVKRKDRTLERSANEVASTRLWGGGATQGRSTVVNISDEDLQKETRFQIESLKLNEVNDADIASGVVAPRHGVNKPTKFNYRAISSTVQSDQQGKRSVQSEDEELVKPVLGLRGDQIHHLHGVQDEGE